MKSYVTIITLFSLGFASAEFALKDANISALQLKKTSPSSKLKGRSLLGRDICYDEDSCADCFGDGYIECPAGSLYDCYDPSLSGSDCGDSSYASSSATDYYLPTSTYSPDAYATGIDFCYEEGATCESCFGDGYVQCADGITCYLPGDPVYGSCDGSGSGDDGSGSSSACEEQFGSGSIPCGVGYCYNPTEGDVCCSNGHHCEGGDTCAAQVGKCCPAGSLTCEQASASASSYYAYTTTSYTYSYTDSYTYSEASTTAESTTISTDTSTSTSTSSDSDDTTSTSSSAITTTSDTTSGSNQSGAASITVSGFAGSVATALMALTAVLLL